MVPRVRRAVLTGFVLALALACGVASDPAVRLATFNTSCDLGISGRYMVVLHPEGDVDDEQLVSGGVPQALVPEVRELRLSDRATIYVVVADSSVVGTGTNRSIPSSRTTYQARFVRIPRLMAHVKTTQPVEVSIGGAPDARVIESIR